MGKYFKISELCKSGSRPDLAAIPDEGTTVYSNLQNLIIQLDIIREKYGRAIYVSSGYRPPALNKAVGGAANSLHTKGAAADLYSKQGNADNVNLLKAIIESGVAYDELIAEYPTFDSNGKMTACKWVHFAFFDGKLNRKPSYYDGKAYKPLKVERITDYTFNK